MTRRYIDGVRILSAHTPPKFLKERRHVYGRLNKVLAQRGLT